MKTVVLTDATYKELVDVFTQPSAPAPTPVPAPTPASGWAITNGDVTHNGVPTNVLSLGPAEVAVVGDTVYFRGTNPPAWWFWNGGAWAFAGTTDPRGAAPTPTTVPVPAPYDPTAGKTVKFQDVFATLDTSKWWCGPKPDWQQYSAAYFAQIPDGNIADAVPYAIVPEGLRIRAQHMPDSWKDPRGWGFSWVSGQLSSCFPGGAGYAFRRGYVEMVAKLPKGKGTWPSLWLLDQAGITKSMQQGAVEIDVCEMYGHDVTAYMATQHNWPPPGANGQPDWSVYQHVAKHVEGIVDWSDGWHAIGAEITDTEVVWYFDRVERFRAPLYRPSTIGPVFPLIALAMSHDWPIEVPPEGHYDMIVKSIRVWEPN